MTKNLFCSQDDGMSSWKSILMLKKGISELRKVGHPAKRRAPGESPHHLPASSGKPVFLLWGGEGGGKFIQQPINPFLPDCKTTFSRISYILRCYF